VPEATGIEQGIVAPPPVPAPDELEDADEDEPDDDDDDTPPEPDDAPVEDDVLDEDPAPEEPEDVALPLLPQPDTIARTAPAAQNERSVFKLSLQPQPYQRARRSSGVKRGSAPRTPDRRLDGIPAALCGFARRPPKLRDSRCPVAQPAFASDDVSVRRRNPWFATAALVLGIGAPPLLVAAALLGHAMPLLGFAPLAALAGLLLWSANPARRERLGRLVINDLGVFVDGQRLAAVSAIREAHLVVVPRDAPLVRIVTRGGARELRVANAAVGRSILAALGFSRRGDGRAIRLASRATSSPGSFAQVTVVAMIVPLLFLAVGLASHGGRAVLLGLVGTVVAAVAFVLASLLSATTVTLGAKGLVIRWLMRRRRIAYDEIVWVRVYEEAPVLFSQRERGVSLLLRSGELVRLPAQGDDEAGTLQGVAEALEEALQHDRRSRRGQPLPEEAVVARRGRRPAEWLEALRAIGSGAAADHRTAPLPSDVLWRLVEDPRIAPEARAGAAVALRGSLDAAGKERLRIAAETTELPRLRVAIETAVDGDEPEMEQALAELEAGEPSLAPSPAPPIDAPEGAASR
jgi:hypothetical protein